VTTGLSVSALTSADDAQVDVVTTHDTLAQSVESLAASASAAAAAAGVKSAADSEAAASSVTDSGCVASPASTSSVVSSQVNDDDIDGRQTDVSTDSICLLRRLSCDTSQSRGAVFWKSVWRQHLCRCPSCMVSSVIVGSCCTQCSAVPSGVTLC